MKKFKKLAAIFLAGIMLLSICGCTLINVDPDRDNAQVIATIGDETIYKVDFNSYMAYMALIYKENSYSMPTGKKLTEFKENIFDSIVDTYALALKADKDGLKVDSDDEDDKESGQDTYDAIVEKLGEDATANILKNYYVTPEQLIDWLDRNTELSAKAQEAFDAYEKKIKEDPSIVLDQVLGKIGDTEITRKVYDYYYINEVAAQGSENTLSEDEINEEIFDTIEVNLANVNYCNEHEIEISENDIKTQRENIETMNSYYGLTDDDLKTVLDQFYLSKDDWDEMLNEDARARAAKQAIQTYERENATVTESAITAYYNENKDSYTEQKVSALHILTDDEALAKRIYEKAKDKDKENFEELVEHYQDDDRITEATDLGAFTHDKMVSEFSKAAFNAEVGTAVGPVKTDYGYHVIFVYDKTGEDGQSLEDAHDEIEETLKEENGSEVYDKLEEKLAKEYKIKIYDFEDVEATYANQVAEEMGLKTYPRRVGI